MTERMIQVRTSDKPNWRSLTGYAEWLKSYFNTNHSLVRSIADDGSWAEWRLAPVPVYHYESHYKENAWTTKNATATLNFPGLVELLDTLPLYTVVTFDYAGYPYQWRKAVS